MKKFRKIILSTMVAVSMLFGGLRPAVSATKYFTDIVVKNPWVDPRLYSSTYINDAISAIGANERTVLISTSMSLSSNLVVPENVTLEFISRGEIVSNSFTLEIQGEIDAGNVKIFSGFTIAPIIGEPVSMIRGYWFGAAHNTVCGAEINMALQSARLSGAEYDVNGIAGRICLLPAGVYFTDIPINIPPQVHLKGVGKSDTWIKAISSAADPIIQFAAESGIMYSSIERMGINGDAKGVVGISISDGTEVTRSVQIKDCFIRNCTKGVNNTSGSSPLYNAWVDITDTVIKSCDDGIFLDGPANATNIIRCLINEVYNYGIRSAATFGGDVIRIMQCDLGGIISIDTVTGGGGLTADLSHNRFEGAQVIAAGSYSRLNFLSNQISLSGSDPFIILYGRESIIDDNKFSGGPDTDYAIEIKTNARENVIGARNVLGTPGGNCPRLLLDNGTRTVVEPNIVVGTKDTNELRDIEWFATPVAGKSPGKIFVQAGSSLGIGSVSTGSITTGTDQLTVDDPTGFVKGSYITIAGITGYFKVLQISGSVFTIDGNADATVSGAAVALSPSVVSFMSPLIGIQTLANEATPSVSLGSNFLTGGTTTITDFDNGQEGQVIRVIAEHSLTITDGTNIFLNGSANFSMNATDTLTLIQKADGKWYELSRSDNT